MKNLYFILIILLLPFFTLFSQTDNENDDEWAQRFQTRFEELSAGSNISQRTRQFLNDNFNSRQLAGPPEEAAGYMFNQAMEIDMQLRRGVPGPRVSLQFRNTIENYNHGKSEEAGSNRGNRPFEIPPGKIGKPDHPDNPGTPEDPGNSGNSNKPDGNNGNSDNNGTNS